MTAKFKDLALDAMDHQAMADWWCGVLGYVRREVAGTRGSPVPIVDPGGEGPLIWINPVPEPKTVKNQMHLDVWGDPEELAAAGARMVAPRGGDREWHQMADPEGNEFCVFER
ncbi:VOC family protein [Amycolatopsis jejuensis]|uniref:VOC family protein n=1 Tax=Amycolatopsis jejuensis TaxID=330084 RepID=UPI000524A351|nr:glyoxalase/bleomycin resistance/extradiol dioxygenase family protein [Amycolatopsis jejuensis]